jgi:hypothetical protein
MNSKINVWFKRKFDLKFEILFIYDVAWQVDRHIELGTKMNLPNIVEGIDWIF